MKPFLSFDGEARNGQYILLQDSDGNILRGNPISIHEALPFLFRPERTCVWYGAGYDWNMLFRDEPKSVQEALFKNPEHKIEMDGYQIDLFPKKIMKLQRGYGHYCSHYDTLGFFQCSFLKAIKDWHIEIPDIVEKGKAFRDNFPKDFDIELYNLTETKLHVELMNRLQAKLDQVGLGQIQGYHGAGAIAALMLDQLKANEHSPLRPLHDFRGYEYRSYYGGRIELFKRGNIQDVYNYDINSAYPAATRELPTLRNANWIHTKGTSALDYNFGVARVKWTANGDNEQMGPFPFRTDEIDGRKRRMVIFPTNGEGYYHLVEIKAALERNLWNIEILNGLALEPGYETPFWKPLDDIMRRRLEFKANKDMAHVPLKLGANSFYGKFAQRNKDKHEFGHYANYWYAGFITAWTRAELLKYAKPDATILMATDGLYSTEPLKCPIGPNLGQWEFEHFKDTCFILPGIYRIDSVYKTRGFPKLPDSEMSNLFTRIVNGEKPTMKQKLFVGVRRSLQLHRKYPKAGFYELSKTIDWTSVEAKRHFVDNSYSEPRNPFLCETAPTHLKGCLEQRISAGFQPWLDGKNDVIDDWMNGVEFLT